MILNGRVWKLGDKVNATDIVSAKFDQQAMAQQYDICAQHVLEDIYPDVAQKLKPGDVLVAGSSFGMGHAHYFGGAILGAREAGISAFLAESISAIFQRMAIEWGMAALEFPGIAAFVNNGDQLEFNLTTGVARNLTANETRQFRPVPQLILDIVRDGGSSNWALRRVGAEHALHG